MSQHGHEQIIIAAIPARLPRRLVVSLSVFIAVGLMALIVGASGEQALRTWQIFLVNFLVWSGIGLAGVVFAAILHVTDGRWAGPIRRLAESTGAFLPISYVAFLLFCIGGQALLPGTRQPLGSPDKAAWLAPRFLLWRDAMALLVLAGVSWVFLYHSLRQDVGLAAERGYRRPGKINQWLIANWKGIDVERARARRILSLVSPLLLILYAYLFSLLAYDLVMSLAVDWYSNLFGLQFFMTNLYVGLAAIAIITLVARRHLGLEAYVTVAQLHDVGKLLFALAAFWAYLTFTHYLVIWYGNVPEETAYLIRRAHEAPWSFVALIVVAFCFLVPFIGLLGREPKRRPWVLLSISAIIMIGVLLERFLLIAPSLWHERDLPLGILEVLITGGFAGAFALSVLMFLRAFPALPLADLTIYGGVHQPVNAPTP
ncbi:MAG: hypothetical protein RMM98_04535 [Acidobacteriota bacterium]|nr:hypothetical protein [Blastocatellia bacterium]MDW8238859.1 hypothetical protein [Acidobacteriota bacterium]